MKRAKGRQYQKNPPGRPKGYVTVARAMEIAQCSEPTMRRWIHKGRVAVVRWRHRTLICEKDLLDWSRVRRWRPRKLAVHARRPHDPEAATVNAAQVTGGLAVQEPEPVACGETWPVKASEAQP